MGDELTSLLAIFKKVEESGGQATLSVTTKSGVTKTKLELVSPPSTPATATTSSSAAPAPGGQRRRRRGPAARMKVNARAAQHQATLAGQTTPTSASLGAHLPPQRPLHIHPSPASDSGQRQVISFGRGKLPTSSFLNLDGSTLPPASPIPTEIYHCCCLCYYPGPLKHHFHILGASPVHQPHCQCTSPC